MSMKIPIPNPWYFDVTTGVALSGIPTSYSADITLQKINIGIDPLDLKIEPLDLSFRIKEIPSIRAHFPVDYRVCVAVLGAEILSVRLCGQSQVITEPYVPNPCECKPERHVIDRGVAQRAPG